MEGEGQHQPGVPVTPPSEEWSQRFAWRFTQQSHDKNTAVPAVARLDALLLLFEEAGRLANMFLSGQGAHLELERLDEGRRLRITLVDGASQPWIDVAATHPSLQGHAAGCAFVRTSAEDGFVYLLPNWHDAHQSWRVAHTGALFTAQHVQDLFLDIFARDPEAAARLSPPGGQTLFTVP